MREEAKEEDAITYAQAAKRLGISPRTVAVYVYDGKLTRAPTPPRVTVASVDQYLAMRDRPRKPRKRKAKRPRKTHLQKLIEQLAADGRLPTFTAT